jgi:hypothetical protein
MATLAVVLAFCGNFIYLPNSKGLFTAMGAVNIVITEEGLWADECEGFVGLLCASSHF